MVRVVNLPLNRLVFLQDLHDTFLFTRVTLPVVPQAAVLSDQLNLAQWITLIDQTLCWLGSIRL